MDRVALIPGGARGIGRGIALALAADGWRVAIAYRTSEQMAAETVRAVAGAGSPGIAVRCDVSDPQACAGLVAQVEAAWGGVDALINCAGPYHRVHLLEETLAGWHEMFDNNLHPVLYLSRAVLPGMQARGWGRIVNFSVANADRLAGHTHVTAYYIAKTGVLVLTRSLAKLAAPHGITVNAISPGFIDSSDGGRAPEEMAPVQVSIPAGRVGTPADVTGAVRFLLSEEAAYVNGTNIHVSGGWGV